MEWIVVKDVHWLVPATSVSKLLVGVMNVHQDELETCVMKVSQELIN